MEDTIAFFGEYKIISLIIHVLAVIFGMGAALISDILFNVYLKNKKINAIESKTLKVLSVIVWASLLFISLSGLGLFLSNPIKYASSTKFLVKISIVGIIILNGYAFWRFIHPALKKIDFTDNNVHHKYVKFRKISFAMGAVSLISWLISFVLGMLKSIPISYQQAMLGYIAICFFGVIFSQIMEYRMTHGVHTK
jgi:hypothetical protein